MTAHDVKRLDAYIERAFGIRRPGAEPASRLFLGVPLFRAQFSSACLSTGSPTSRRP